MKKVLVVRGSEDGNLGVYGNFKAAHSKAIGYLRSHKVLDGNEKYNVAVKRFGGNWIEIEGQDEMGHLVYASIESFYLNDSDLCLVHN